MIGSIFRFLHVAFALACTLVAGFCLWVCMAAGWRSDGPGLLLFMIGLGFAGPMACALWWWLFQDLTGMGGDDAPPPNWDLGG